MRVLLLADPSTAASTALLSHCGPVTETRAAGSSGQSPLFSFDLHSNGPDESQHLSTDRRDDLRFILAIGQQGSIPRVQSNLGLPGDCFDFVAQVLLSFEQVSAAPRPELIGPGGFDDHTSQVGVAGLRDAVLLRCAPLEPSLGTRPL